MFHSKTHVFLFVILLQLKRKIERKYLSLRYFEIINNLDQKKRIDTKNVFLLNCLIFINRLSVSQNVFIFI